MKFAFCMHKIKYYVSKCSGLFDAFSRIKQYHDINHSNGAVFDVVLIYMDIVFFLCLCMKWNDHVVIYENILYNQARFSFIYAINWGFFLSFLRLSLTGWKSSSLLPWLKQLARLLACHFTQHPHPYRVFMYIYKILPFRICTKCIWGERESWTWAGKKDFNGFTF